MIGTTHYLVLAALLFAMGLGGVLLNRNNLIALLMCVELMLLAVNFNFIAFAHAHGDIAGQLFVFFVLTVAAAEAAIGLALIILLFRHRTTIDVNTLNLLKG